MTQDTPDSLNGKDGFDGGAEAYRIVQAGTAPADVAEFVRGIALCIRMQQHSAENNGTAINANKIADAVGVSPQVVRGIRHAMDEAGEL